MWFGTMSNLVTSNYILDRDNTKIDEIKILCPINWHEIYLTLYFVHQESGF